MYIIQEGNTYNVPIPTYYVESTAELATIPITAPPGTIAEVNDANGFKVFMKNSNNEWNEL